MLYFFFLLLGLCCWKLVALAVERKEGIAGASKQERKLNIQAPK